MAKVIVVDGNSFMAKFYTVKLKDLGHEVDTFLSGDKAFDQIKTEHYDAILMDVVLPYRDGFTILNDLNTMKKGIPVRIIASEVQQKESIERAKALGVQHYFIKNEAQTYDIVDTLHDLIKGIPSNKKKSEKAPKKTQKKPTSTKKTPKASEK